jgi:hypothetical protein
VEINENIAETKQPEGVPSEPAKEVDDKKVEESVITNTTENINHNEGHLNAPEEQIKHNTTEIKAEPVHNVADNDVVHHTVEEKINEPTHHEEKVEQPHVHTIGDQIPHKDDHTIKSTESIHKVDDIKPVVNHNATEIIQTTHVDANAHDLENIKQRDNITTNIHTNEPSHYVETTHNVVEQDKNVTSRKQSENKPASDDKSRKQSENKLSADDKSRKQSDNKEPVDNTSRKQSDKVALASDNKSRKQSENKEIGPGVNATTIPSTEIKSSEHPKPHLDAHSNPLENSLPFTKPEVGSSQPHPNKPESKPEIHVNTTITENTSIKEGNTNTTREESKVGFLLDNKSEKSKSNNLLKYYYTLKGDKKDTTVSEKFEKFSNVPNTFSSEEQNKMKLNQVIYYFI